MLTAFQKNLVQLIKIATRYDSVNNEKKRLLLQQISKDKLAIGNGLNRYHDLLLFLIAFPADPITHKLSGQELIRISSFLRNVPFASKKKLTNSGLPFTRYISSFSYDFVKWLIKNSDCRIDIYKFNKPAIDVNEVLGLVLPPVLQSVTTAGYTTEELFDALQVSSEKRLHYLLSEFRKLEDHPAVRDLLFDSMKLDLEILPVNKFFSRAFNRVSVNKIFYHDSLLREFDHRKLIQTKIGNPLRFSSVRKKAILQSIKNSMALTDRETDTVTYMDERSLRYYELERGISIALYGMVPERQLPYESYVGYTLFKNGLPAAYGGGWVFGSRANFGINIFESFRGGESGYMFCHLLRIYQQIFGISYFEVEPYQFGADNEDGIDSGAFWFYYRYGFKPVDRGLKKVAKIEWDRISNRRNYRTGSKILRQLAADNIVLDLGKPAHVRVQDITNKIKRMISKEFHNDTSAAEEACTHHFLKATIERKRFNMKEKKTLGEIALWAQAFRIQDKPKLKMMVQMIRSKPVDLYAYQALLKNLLN